MNLTKTTHILVLPIIGVLRRTSLPFLLSLSLFSAPLFAESAGTTAANFLKIGIGARGSAMGEAQTAVTEDVTSHHWNPAGLTNMRFKEVSLMHYKMVEGIRYQQASFGMPHEKLGHIAFGLNRLDYGDIQGFDNSSLPTGNVDASSLLLTASWARKVLKEKNLSIGANLKYLNAELAGFKAATPMIDFGASLPFEAGRLKDLRVAAGFRNLGPDIKFDTEGSPLPRQLYLGSGLHALGGNLVLALDLIYPTEQDSYIASGLEYRVFDLLRLRVGYNTRSKFVGSGITYGLGLEFNNWKLDYALVPFGDFGDTNRVSIGVKFGKAQKMAAAEEQVDHAYKKARRQLALGKGVQAYTTVNEILTIAPWHRPSIELKAKIEKEFSEMAASKNKARMEAEIADKFTSAKAAFDRDELVEARKGFESVLYLQPEHVGAKVYLERIESRYNSLSQESFKNGMAFYAAGDYEKAIVAFEKTLTIDANHDDARAQLEKTRALMADAAKQAEEQIMLSEAGAAYKQGLDHFQKTEYEQALGKFEEVQELMPEYEEVGRYLKLTKETYASVLFEESQVLFENGQLGAAVERLERSYELNPADARVAPALEIARRDLQIKNAQLSKKQYQEGLEAYLSGNTLKAERLWKSSLELDSSNEDALKALTKLEEQRNYEKQQ